MNADFKGTHYGAFTSDGTNYELVYIGIATKKGYLQSETSDFYYFTSSDIIGVWANLSKMRLDF